MRFLLSLLLLLCSLGAHAQTTIYYNRCDAGAHASCVAGSDANPGTSPSAPKLSLPSNDAINALAGGSNVRLCNGSAWVDGNATGWLLQNSNATRTARITVENYDCGNGATGQPILQYSSGTGSGMLFGGFCVSGCPAPDHGGYVLRGVRITKSGSPSGTGLVFYGSTRWTLIEDVRVDNWANGYEVHTGSNIRDLTIRGTTPCNPADSGITACAASIDSNCQNGLIGSASDFLVERVLFQANNPASAGCGAFTLQHGSYVGGTEPQSRITFRQNIYRNNSLTSGVCGSGNATFRGMVNGLTVEENLIQSPGGNSACIGVSIQDGYGSDEECVRGLVVRGNKVVDSGSSGFLGRITPGALFENNEVYAFNTTTAMTAINIANPGSAQDLAVCPAGTAIVRNNSAYYASGTSGQAVSVNAGSGHSVFNNLAVVASGSSANCWAHAGGTFTLWDYNWCYEQGSGQWSATYANLAAAQAAGFDANGGNTDPLLAATPNSSSHSMALQSGSPLRSAGRNTGKAPRDLLWCQRDETPDIGAHEYGASTCITFRAPVELR
jgi:hypothetical protein